MIVVGPGSNNTRPTVLWVWSQLNFTHLLIQGNANINFKKTTTTQQPCCSHQVTKKQTMGDFTLRPFLPAGEPVLAIATRLALCCCFLGLYRANRRPSLNRRLSFSMVTIAQPMTSWPQPHGPHAMVRVRYTHLWLTAALDTAHTPCR